ncbi:MAG: hypothetical protein LAP40_10120 [Acidobacteriia bacterium]|nr:hypothetical protein [Terriglobia bacterium]
MLWWRVETSASETSDNLHVYDRDGHILFRQRVWIPDASTVQIRDAAISNAGTIAIAGVVFADSGAVAGFWGWLPPGGGTATIIRTSPFEATNIAIGPDLDVWVLGWELGPGRKLNTAAPHSTLRHYDRKGNLLDQHLQWPDSECSHSHPTQQLVAAKNRVGVFLPSCRQWLEFAANGELMKTRRLPYLPSDSDHGWLTSGVVFTDNDDLYINFRNAIFRLDTDDSQWVSVEPLGWHSAFVGIVGADGSSLVGMGSPSEISWMPLQ